MFCVLKHLLFSCGQKDDLQHRFSLHTYYVCAYKYVCSNYQDSRKVMVNTYTVEHQESWNITKVEHHFKTNTVMRLPQ